MKMTYMRPGILIFTGVIHKEGNTSDSHTSDNFHEKCILQNVCCKVLNHMLLIMIYSLLIWLNQDSSLCSLEGQSAAEFSSCSNPDQTLLPVIF